MPSDKHDRLVLAVRQTGSVAEAFLGGHRGEGTPDPIPNSAVKLSIADDTAYLYVGK